MLLDARSRTGARGAAPPHASAGSIAARASRFAPARVGRRVARPVERRAGRVPVGKLREIALRLRRLRLGLGQIGAAAFRGCPRRRPAAFRSSSPAGRDLASAARARASAASASRNRGASRSVGLGCPLPLERGPRRRRARPPSARPRPPLSRRRARRAGCAAADARRPETAAAAIAMKPSQRHSRPSRSTSRWPGARLGCRRRPASALSTQPACAEAARKRRRRGHGFGQRARAPRAAGGHAAPPGDRPKSVRQRCCRSSASGASSSSSNAAPIAASNPAATRSEDRIGGRLARIRRRGEQRPQSLGLGGEPGQPSIGFPRRVERRLLVGEAGLRSRLRPPRPRRGIARPAASACARRQRQRRRSPPARPARRRGSRAAAPPRRGAPPAVRGARPAPCGAARVRRGGLRPARRPRSPAAAPPRPRPRRARFAQRQPAAANSCGRAVARPRPGRAASRSSDSRVERRLRLGQMRLLAFEIGGELGEPPLGLAARGEHPLQLLLERVAGLRQALQLGGGRGLGLTQRRQRRLGGFASPRSARGRARSPRRPRARLREARRRCVRPRPRAASQRAWNSSASVRRICSARRR